MKLLPHFQIFSPNQRSKTFTHRVDVHTEVERDPFYLNKRMYSS